MSSEKDSLSSKHLSEASERLLAVFSDVVDPKGLDPLTRLLVLLLSPLPFPCQACEARGGGWIWSYEQGWSDAPLIAACPACSIDDLPTGRTLQHPATLLTQLQDPNARNELEILATLWDQTAATASIEVETPEQWEHVPPPPVDVALEDDDGQLGVVRRGRFSYEVRTAKASTALETRSLVPYARWVVAALQGWQWAALVAFGVEMLAAAQRAWEGLTKPCSWDKGWPHGCDGPSGCSACGGRGRVPRRSSIEVEIEGGSDEAVAAALTYPALTYPAPYPLTYGNPRAAQQRDRESVSLGSRAGLVCRARAIEGVDDATISVDREERTLLVSYWGSAHPARVREALEVHMSATVGLEVARVHTDRSIDSWQYDTDGDLLLDGSVTARFQSAAPRTVQETVEYRSARYGRLVSALAMLQTITRDGIEYLVESYQTDRHGDGTTTAEFTLREVFRVSDQINAG